ncbi:MAG: hypothetical protein GY747_13975 [Planctomycetes bacterium]|nr:hypothetical protein [Planctomycetota bacterium]MCP4772350.1 hypothetical protein [Planctomycetota bacterium]MCP4861550.1 hypothetical protein [Planctomycetota bacterium]
MPPTSAADATRVLLLQRPDLELAVQRWRQRLPRPEALGSATDILDDLAGALWLELAACAKPMEQRYRCLRRVLYREHECGWRLPYVGLGATLSSPLSSAPPPQPATGSAAEELDLPRHLWAWAQSYLDQGGPQGRLDYGAALCGSRRLTRLRNSALFKALADGRYVADLRKRAARLLSAAAIDGAHKAHRKEARAILCMLKMLEPTAEHSVMRLALSRIAAQ